MAIICQAHEGAELIGIQRAPVRQALDRAHVHQRVALEDGLAGAQVERETDVRARRRVGVAVVAPPDGFLAIALVVICRAEGLIVLDDLDGSGVREADPLWRR